MQNQLEITTQSLRKNPAVAIRLFQQILSRPSYFQAIPRSDRWRVLLGPSTRPISVSPSADVAVIPNQAIPRVFDFVAAQPRIHLRVLKRTQKWSRALLLFTSARLISAHQWLMHPIIDSRESS